MTPPLTTFEGLVEFAEGFAPRPSISHVLFDFDGTLSLIRQGWPEVMVPMFVEVAAPRYRAKRTSTCARLVIDDIMRLNGKQTIYQMIQLAERIKERGGTPREPLCTSTNTCAGSMQHIGVRTGRLCQRTDPPDELLVYGSRRLLEPAALGLPLYLASGTDESVVKREAALLDVDALFRRAHLRRRGRLQAVFQENGHRADPRGRTAIPGGSCSPSATAMWKSKTPRKQAAWPWLSPAMKPTTAPERSTSGSTPALGVGADVVIPDFRDGCALGAHFRGEINMVSSKNSLRVGLDEGERGASERRA